MELKATVGITSYLLPWFQVALGFQKGLTILSHQQGFNLFSFQSKTGWGMVEMWEVGLQSCPFLHLAPRCYENRAGLNEGQSEVTLLESFILLLQPLLTHCPVSYRDDKREKEVEAK